jgi:hypothetical protein
VRSNKRWKNKKIDRERLQKAPDFHGCFDLQPPLFQTNLFGTNPCKQ